MTALIRIAFLLVRGKYPSHHLRGDPKQLGSIAEVYAMLCHQPQVGLVNQRGRLQRMGFAFAPHVAARQTIELFIHKRKCGIQAVPRSICGAMYQTGENGVITGLLCHGPIHQR